MECNVNAKEYTLGNLYVLIKNSISEEYVMTGSY